MTTLEQFISPALTQALGWTLLHSLWQGALVAAVLAGVLLLLRRQRAEVRYVASATALGVAVALAGITFGLYFGGGRATSRPTPGTIAPASVVREVKSPRALLASVTARKATPESAGRSGQAVAQALLPVESPSAGQSLRHSLLVYVDRSVPLLVVAWLLGLLAMSLRMVGGLLYVQRLRRYRVRPLGAVWQARLTALTARSGLRRPVALLESALVKVPLVVGHVRPVILLPLGAVAGLPASYLEAILAHELAHVLRRDYLVNLLQTVAEVLFFYHPAVWFMAGCVRTERENCCDDTATALVGGDPLRLARALTALAEWSQSAVVPAPPRLALAALGSRGALLNRVRRLVQRRPAAPTLAEGVMAGALLLSGLGLLGGSMVLAGPLETPARPVAVAKQVPFNWQASPGQGVPKAAGVGADTTKGAKGAAAIPGTAAKSSVAPLPVPPVVPPLPPDAPAPPLERRREITVTQEGPDGPHARGAGRVERRVIVNGREMGSPSGSGRPGTVVITKDKKGRLTDLVVNGQRVEAATAKPSKAEKRADRQVTVVTSEPDHGAEHRERKASGTYVYVSPEGGPRPGRPRNIHINIDGEAIARLAENAVTLGAEGLNLGLRAAAEGLEDARRELEAELRAPGLSARTRREVEQALDETRRELGRLRRNRRSAPPERAEAEERADQAREQVDEAREKAEEVRERRRELQERIRETEQELRELEGARNEGGRGPAGEEAMVNGLRRDGLLKDPDNYQFRLTARSLTIDGKEQSEKVRQKYLKLYESSTGRKMSATGAITLNHSGSRVETRRNNDFGGAGPRPPRPPRAPRVGPPTPPPPPGALNLPPPPRAPEVDTQGIRQELRNDGLLGPNDKAYQLQLTAGGITVNGKRLSDEQAAKYRKLLGPDDGPGHIRTISISSQE